MHINQPNSHSKVIKAVIHMHAAVRARPCDDEGGGKVWGAFSIFLFPPSPVLLLLPLSRWDDNDDRGRGDASARTKRSPVAATSFSGNKTLSNSGGVSDR